MALPRTGDSATEPGTDTKETSKMIAVGANWDSRLTPGAHRVFKKYTEKFSHSEIAYFHKQTDKLFKGASLIGGYGRLF